MGFALQFLSIVCANAPRRPPPAYLLRGGRQDRLFARSASAPVIAVGYIGPTRRFDNRLPLMSCSSHYSEKFEVLGLPQLWEEAAGRADFHLSEPE